MLKEQSETLKENTLVRTILNAFVMNNPGVKVRYVEEDNIIVFEVKEGSEWEILEPVINEILGITKYGNVAPLTRPRFLFPSLLPKENLEINNCYIFRASNCESLFIIPESDYENVQGKRIKTLDETVEKLLRIYFGKKDFSEKEVLASKVLLGEYNLIAPVLFGIKPVAVIDDYGQIEFLEKLASDVSDFKVVHVMGVSPSGESYDHYVIYKINAVKEMVNSNVDIVEMAGFSASSSPEEIIKQLFIDMNPILGQNSLSIQRAAGILLGFDRNSVVKYNKEVTTLNPKWISNIWCVQYRVADDQHEDFKILQIQYDSLLKTIEELLKKGLSPHQILKVLPQMKDLKNAQTDIKKALMDQLGS